MKNEDINNRLGSMGMPDPKNLHQQELKIPLLRYKKSSRAGLWLLLIPVTAALTGILKYDLVIASPFLDAIEDVFAFIDKNVILTFLIPLIFIGLPLLSMILNFLAFGHFSYLGKKKELLVTIKYRPLNIVVFLFSFAVLVFFLLPDRLSF